MPRGRRIDAPGTFHHVIARGIEKRLIFRDDADRREFLRRLGCVLPELSFGCIAWALMPNHVHLVLRTGDAPLGKLMARLNTGYAMYFNRRHERVGHLFQNRYMSIPIEDEAYLRALVRYVHLNPLRAGLVASLEELSRYPWTGHAGLVGGGTPSFQWVDAVLAWFRGRTQGLEEWMADGAGQVAPSDSPHAASMDALLEVLCERLDVPRESLRAGTRGGAIAELRAVSAYLGCEELGLPAGELASALGMGRRGLRKAVERGRGLAPQRSREAASSV